MSNTAHQVPVPEPPAVVLRTAPRPSALRGGRLAGLIGRGLRRNAGLRVIAVLLAIGLWIFVNAGQHGALESFSVPISYRDLPPHLVITNPHPQSLKLEVSGPRTLLSLIDPNRLTLKLDLTGVAVGQASYKVSADAFNVPRQTTVVGVAPSQIVLDVDRIITRDVPVHLKLSGAPASGYRVASMEVEPPTVTVRGPSKELAHVEEVESEAVDLEGAMANLGRRITLTAPFDRARLFPAEVTANLVVSPIVETREFRGVPVQIRATDAPFRVDPAHVSLTVRGTQIALARLDLHEAAYIDADGMAPGLYDAPVQVALPDGIELLHQSAMKVKLRIYRTRRPPQRP